MDEPAEHTIGRHMHEEPSTDVEGLTRGAREPRGSVTGHARCEASTRRKQRNRKIKSVAHLTFGPDGAYRICGDRALKQKIQRLAQRASSDVAQRLLTHPAVFFDDWSCAEHQHNLQRARRCRALVASVEHRLQADEVVFEGLEGTTGQPALTADKLKGHGVKLLDVGDRWLLLAIERHPKGGRGTTLVQYWLYNRRTRRLRLLTHRDDVETVRPRHDFVERNGQWQPVDADGYDEFRNLVEELLGPEARRNIEAAIWPQETGLLESVPEQVAAECLELTDVDIVAEEKRQRALREEAHVKRYGPQRQSGAPGIYMVSNARIRIGRVRSSPRPAIDPGVEDTTKE